MEAEYFSIPGDAAKIINQGIERKKSHDNYDQTNYYFYHHDEGGSTMVLSNLSIRGHLRRVVSTISSFDFDCTSRFGRHPGGAQSELVDNVKAATQTQSSTILPTGVY